MVAVASFASGNTEIGIAQVINLVTIVFSMFNPTCFTGDTPVYTDDGLVYIEEVNVGDEVWAYNPETGETELKEVLNVWIKETDEILHVSTSDGETIDTTTNHPFYVEDKGWVAAGDLEIGDTLVTADGDKVEVDDIEIEKLAEPILVYNLEVEDFHTYFVGEYGVLVHNVCMGVNIKDDSRDHIFSKDHLKNGIMELGNSEDEIMDSALNIIKELDLQNRIGEGSTWIRTHINNLESEIRLFVKNGELVNFDMFKGWSVRDFFNVIYFD